MATLYQRAMAMRDAANALLADLGFPTEKAENRGRPSRPSKAASAVAQEQSTTGKLQDRVSAKVADVGRIQKPDLIKSFAGERPNQIGLAIKRLETRGVLTQQGDWITYNQQPQAQAATG